MCPNTSLYIYGYVPFSPCSGNVISVSGFAIDCLGFAIDCLSACCFPARLRAWLPACRLAGFACWLATLLCVTLLCFSLLCVASL